MKRLIYFLMAMGMISSLAACGSGETKSEPQSSVQSDIDQVEKPDQSQPPADNSQAKGGDLLDSSAPPPPQGGQQEASGSAPGFNETYRKFNDARQAGSLSAATAAAGEILTHNPNDSKVLNALAVMAINQEKYDLARLYLAKVMEKDPNNSAAYDNLGVIELKTDNLRLALVQFKKATELDNRNKAAHANLGTIYLQYRNYPNAVAELEAAVEDGDQSPAIYSNLGYALAGAGEYPKAQDAYEKALAKDETNIPLMVNYAALLVQHNLSKDKATKLLNKIRFVAHEPAILNKVEALLRKLEGGSNNNSGNLDNNNNSTKPAEPADVDKDLKGELD